MIIKNREICEKHFMNLTFQLVNDKEGINMMLSAHKLQHL